MAGSKASNGECRHCLLSACRHFSASTSACNASSLIRRLRLMRFESKNSSYRLSKLLAFPLKEGNSNLVGRDV
jgi:hypothetical protein